MVFQLNAEEKLVREKTRAAVSQAMERRWDEAVVSNRELLALVPDDVEASNRLGRAYKELGRLTDAAAAFKHSLELDPANTIARKNLDRLASLGRDGAVAAQSTNAGGAPPVLFISDSGKSTKVTLTSVGKTPSCEHLAAGALVELRPSGEGLLVCDNSGQTLGAVPPNVGARLTRLMEGGNRYDGALVSVTGDDVTVLLREVHQDPSQRRLVSFPSNGGSAAQVDEVDTTAPTPGAELDQNLPTSEDEGAEAALPIEDTDDENRFLMSDDGDQDDEGTLQSPASLDPAAEPELEDGEDESEAI